MLATSSRNQSPHKNMARCRTLRRATASASEDVVTSVSSWLTEKKFRDAECADITYVGARRPCTAFLGRRVRESNARNVIAQAFIA
jgi:hypothetical protein